jgi:ferritin
MIDRVKLPIHNKAGIDEIIKKLLKQELEVTKVVNRISKSKKDKQHNGNQKKRDKRTNNDLQKTTQKIKDRATVTPPTTGALEV